MNLSQDSQLAEYGYFNPVKSVVTICSTIVDIQKLHLSAHRILIYMFYMSHSK